MKTSKLPPELVEKMQTAIDSLERPLTASEKCAQIAVEYSRWSTIERERLQLERDELLEALMESKTEIIKLKDHYHDVGHGLKHLMKIDELINRIDGK